MCAFTALKYTKEKIWEKQSLDYKVVCGIIQKSAGNHSCAGNGVPLLLNFLNASILG